MSHTDVERQAGVLRCARAELIPLVPELAPELQETPNVFQYALGGILTQRGIDPLSIDPANRNKVERHAIVGFLLGEVREQAVEGTGREAYFRDPAQLGFMQRVGRLPLTRFKRTLVETLGEAADQVEDEFTNGSDPQHRWFPLAAERYQGIGGWALNNGGKRRLRGIVPWNPLVINSVPLEGHDLRVGIRSPSLANLMPSFIRSIRNVEAPDARTAAAHDLTHLLTTPAGLHSMELIASLVLHGLQTKGDVQQDKKGVYRLTFPEGSKPRQRNTYVRLDDLPSARLKCAAHVVTRADTYLKGDAQAGTAPGHPPAQPTNLQTLIHAAINLAADRKLF